MMTSGIILLAVGLILFTAGGLIAMARNPKAFDDDIHASLGIPCKGLPKDAHSALDRVMLQDPKTKWFTRIGIALCLAGIAMLAWASENGQDAEAIGSLGVSHQMRKN
jgi:uncharacterized membrane protein